MNIDMNKLEFKVHSHRADLSGVDTEVIAYGFDDIGRWIPLGFMRAVYDGHYPDPRVTFSAIRSHMQIEDGCADVINGLWKKAGISLDTADLSQYQGGVY
jgi:hypothetical protein